MKNIWDAHVHLGPSGEWLPYLDPSVETDALIEKMDDNDIEKSIVFPNPCVGDKYPEMNDYIAEAVKSYPERLIGFGRVDPRRKEEAVSEVERLVDLDMKGVKLHPYVETYRPDHPNFEELFDIMYENELIILTHTGSNFASPGHMKSVLEEREDMKVILGHLNEGCISVAEDFENVYVDTSGSRVYMLEYSMDKIPEKVVFGSDFPYLNYEVQKKVIEAAGLSSEQKEKIFRKNLKELLDKDQQ
ncbi:MAG: amidohydrolase [Candidatus Thermoplasmatota archaeon]|nr:amidohydrolase [Candidatus Thermoplasmatota archaeon]